MQQFYSTKQVAEILSVSVEAVEKWRKQGKLRPVKAGSLCRYPENELWRFLAMTEDGQPYANENIDEEGRAIGGLAEAQKEYRRN